MSAKVYQYDLEVNAPFGVQKWEIGSKEDPHLRRSLNAKSKTVLIVAILLTLLITTVVLVCLLVPSSEKDSWLPEYKSDSKLGRFESAAVSTDAAPCAGIGKDLLKRNGSVVDAAIAVLLCMGVVTPQSLGLGGGFFMILYNRTEREAYFLDAREIAPAKATEDMFQGNATLAKFGGLSIAVPGEIAGYVEMHRRFGRLPWKDLFPPTIKMCREGITVNAHLDRALKKYENKIFEYEPMRNLFVDNTTGRVYKLNDVFTRKDLADTLEAIARDKKKALYGGSKLAEQFLKDLQDVGSIIEESDMRNYAPVMRVPIKKVLRNNMTLYSVSTPGSGALLGFMLGVLDGYKDLNADVTKTRSDTVRALHRIVETFKFAYARRMELEDRGSLEDGGAKEIQKIEEELLSMEYAEMIRAKINDDRTYNNVSYYGINVTVQEDHGTAHVSIVGENGDAVAITSTINQYFGSMILSPSTGIILNDEMDDFASPNVTNYFGVPPTSNNRIRPGKRPFSSMTPAIIVDSDDNVRLAVGGNGGTQITTSVAQTIIRNLWLGQDIKKSIDAPRFHHQLLPNYIEHEQLFPKDILEDLHGMGHELHLLGNNMLGIIMGIARGEDGFLYANSDWRKGGAVDGY